MINFLQLKEAVAEVYPEIRLCYGAELYYSKDILSKLEKRKYPHLMARAIFSWSSVRILLGKRFKKQ